MSIRTERVQHTHITQSENKIYGCPACDLIRPEVMSGSAARILRYYPNAENWFGKPRNQEES